MLLEAILDVPSCATSAQGLSPEGAAALAALIEDLLDIATRAGAAPVAVGDLDLLVAWDVGGEQLASMLERALACAVSLYGRVRAGLAGSAGQLELRCSLVGGQVSLGAYGGLAGPWLPLLCGRPLAELGSLAALCGAGEVAVGAMAAAAWLGHPAGRAVGRGQLVLALGGTEPVGPARTLSASCLSRRDGTLAVVELLGLEPGRGDQVRRLQAAVRAVQRVARLHGGVVQEIRQDHRGLCAWIWFWGGEHGRRPAALGALRFGLEVASALADHGVQAPVGVGSGEAFFWEPGRVHGIARAGPPVSRAARQVRATACEVVCDTATALRVGDAATLVELSLHTAAGGEDGQRFRVEDVRPAPRRRPVPASALVGHGEELARALLVLEEFEAGGSAALVVEGAQGMGKSLLLGVLAEQVAGKGWAIARVGGASGPAAGLRARWRDALLVGLGIDPHIPREELAVRVDELLASGGIPRVSSALAAVLFAESNGDTRRPGRGSTVGNLAREVASLLGVRPMVLFVEDAQWLDSASWRLLRELVDEVARILVVVAVRTGASAVPIERQRLEVVPEATVVSLRTLPLASLVALLGRDLTGDPPPERLVHWLARASGGNPGLFLEWWRLLLDDGVVELADRRVRAFHGDRLEAAVPVGSGPWLTRRIARLGPDVLRTLAVAQLVGSPFDAALIVAAHPDQPGRLRVEGELEQLRALGLLRVARAPDAEIWRLAQELPGGSTAQAMSCGEVRGVHGRAAAFLQSQADDLGRLYATLAHHWQAAGQDARAIDCFELAGAEAQRLGAMREACQHFQLALRIADTHPELAIDPVRRAHWERNLGEARYACGELDRCGVHFRRALAALDRPLPTTSVGVLLDVAWQVACWVFSPPLGYTTVRLDAEELSRLHEASHAAERLAERFYFSANLPGLVATSLRSANLARRMGSRGRNGRPFASLGVLAGLAGAGRYTLGLHQRALRISREACDSAGVVVALYTRAAYHVGRGEWREGVALADEAVAEAAAVAAWQEGGVAHTAQGMARCFQGAYTAAEASYLSLLERARRYDNAQHEAWALFGLGLVQLRTGRLHEAVRSVLQALVVLRHLDDYPSRLICQGVLASSYLRQGRFEEAVEAAERGWSAAQQVAWPFVLSTLDGYRGVAEVFVDAWRREQAGGREFPLLARRARRAIRLLGRFAMVFPIGRPPWLLARAQSASIEGRAGRAAALGRRALAAATALGMAPEVGIARAFLARHGGLPEAERAAMAAAAAEVFSSTGSLWHLEELKKDQQGQSQ